MEERRWELRIAFIDLVDRIQEALPGATEVTFTRPGECPQGRCAETFDPFQGTDQHLQPSTPYTATITWDGGTPTDLDFQTSAVGAPLNDPEMTLTGGDFRLDLASATFTEPPGVGSLLAQYISDVHMVFHIDGLDDVAGTVEVYSGLLEEDGNDYVQDMCVPTTDFPTGDWSNPYLEIGPADVEVDMEGYGMPLTGLTIGGSFTVDGLSIAGGTYDAQMDTRALDPLIDPDADPGATCDLMATLGISCEPCADGSGTFCLTISAQDVAADSVNVLAFHPVSGNAIPTLVEVTAADVASWPACN